MVYHDSLELCVTGSEHTRHKMQIIFLKKTQPNKKYLGQLTEVTSETETDLQFTGTGVPAELSPFALCATRNVVGDMVYTEHKLILSSSQASSGL